MSLTEDDDRLCLVKLSGAHKLQSEAPELTIYSTKDPAILNGVGSCLVVVLKISATKVSLI